MNLNEVRMKKNIIISALLLSPLLPLVLQSFSGGVWRGAGAEVFAQNLNVTFRAQLPYPGQTCANICGYVDSLGNEYALVGASKGMSIVDVTVPNNPVKVKQVPGPDNEWKEIKVRGKYAYVTTEGGGVTTEGAGTITCGAGMNTGCCETYTGAGTYCCEYDCTQHVLYPPP